jgi:hypothetical protein
MSDTLLDTMARNKHDVVSGTLALESKVMSDALTEWFV